MELLKNNSNFLRKWYRLAFTTGLCAILSSTLITSKLFVYASLTPLYLYLIFGSALIIFLGILVFFKSIKIHFNSPITLILLWIAYIMLHGFLQKTFNPFHLYLVFSLIFLITLNALIQVDGLRLTALFRSIIIIASIEALFCLGQSIGILHTYNIYFPVTGSWGNPNVTAMFIAMTVPIMIELSIEEKRIFKVIAVSSLVLSVIALFLLECRTALIGSTIATFLLLNYHYGLISWILNKRNRSAGIIITLICVSLLIPLFSYVYNAKKASADGRRLIWRLSMEMVMRKPISGYGYGLFERNYNLFQSDYFKAGNGTSKEVQQAGFVHMGYNELLENAVQGGLPGLILVGGLFLSLLLVPASTRKIGSNSNSHNHYFIVAYAGIAAFVVMSLCNFTIQAIPVMSLFIIYSALLTTHPSLQKNENDKTGFVYHLSYLTVLPLGIYLLYLTCSSANANMLNKKAGLQARNGDSRLAEQTLIPLGKVLNSEESYWNNYATILMKKKDYKGAITLFNKAKNYTSDPEIFIKTGNCYQKVADYKNAERNFLIAKYIEPSRLTPKVALMNLYWEQKDSINTIALAKEIINRQLKIPSNKASNYKNQAILIMKKMGKDIGEAPIYPNGQPMDKIPYLHKSI